ncbi:CKB isoform 6 [Pan troglodytes]|uniref:Creatine kinase B n=4 Tax=Catarrhini TaxID=9526 RepID=G3V2I1_HUMAN|nr:creatine kinase B [Homo sapiens]KAI4062558.1 creatine kinase B [Homo sapiens]PNI97134.1 CKB isoform 6 [Pan troglodytes]PNJ26157.1 CKB isoform 6 [Pongo abelii]
MPFSNSHNALKLRFPAEDEPPVHHDRGLRGGRRGVLRSVQGSLRPHHRGPARRLQAQR